MPKAPSPPCLTADVSCIIMNALDKGYHLPVVFSLFGLFFASMVIYDLRTGEIWRGGPKPTIAVVNDAGQFYIMISGFSVMALAFLGGAVWTLFLLLRRKTK